MIFQGWLTPSLLQQIVSDPLLVKSMSEPRFQEAIALLQKSPAEAKKKYQNDSEVTEMIIRYMRIIGTHFEVLGRQEQSKTSHEVEVEAILKDTDVIKIIEFLRNGGKLDPRTIPSPLFKKLRVLIDQGLLNIGA